MEGYSNKAIASKLERVERQLSEVIKLLKNTPPQRGQDGSGFKELRVLEKQIPELESKCRYMWQFYGFESNGRKEFPRQYEEYKSLRKKLEEKRKQLLYLGE